MSDIINNNLSYTDKDFQTIFPELLDLAKKLTDKWDPSQSNESDPGVVLLKLLAVIADKNNYNIDKNILECFPASVTQEKNARALFEQLGYNPRWYKSATTDSIAMSFIGDISENEDLKDLDNNKTYLYIPPFTMVSNETGDIVYTLLNTATDSNGNNLYLNGTRSVFNAIQGIVNTFNTTSTNIGSTRITLANIDENNRLYFPTNDVAENGIFIIDADLYEDKAGEPDVNLYDWVRVDNLAVEAPGQKVYKFGISQKTGNCYIEFPLDIASLIGNGLTIKYVRSSGYYGNTIMGTINTFQKDGKFKVFYDGDKTLENVELSLTADNFVMRNESAITNGYNPESIDSAYNNYQKTIGVFNTLVTLRDYINRVQVVGVDNGLASNGFVTDRTNDIQDSYNIITLNKDLLDENHLSIEKELEHISVETTPVEEAEIPQQLEGNIAVDSLDAFDLKLYLLEFKSNPERAESNAMTYHYLSPLEVSVYNALKEHLDADKSIQHNFKEASPNKICLFKNKFNVNCNIIPAYKLSEKQIGEIKNKVQATIYSNINSQHIDFSDEISYDYLYDLILNCDERIKAIALEPLKYNTYAVYFENIYVKDSFGKYVSKNLVKEVLINDIVDDSEYLRVTITGNTDNTNTVLKSSSEANTALKPTVLSGRYIYNQGDTFTINCTLTRTNDNTNEYPLKFALDNYGLGEITSVTVNNVEYPYYIIYNNGAADALALKANDVINENEINITMQFKRGHIYTINGSNRPVLYSTSYNKFRTDIYAKSILAGKTSLYIKDDEFEYSLAQKGKKIIRNVDTLSTETKIVFDFKSNDSAKTEIATAQLAPVGTNGEVDEGVAIDLGASSNSDITWSQQVNMYNNAYLGEGVDISSTFEGSVVGYLPIRFTSISKISIGEEAEDVTELNEGDYSYNSDTSELILYNRAPSYWISQQYTLGDVLSFSNNQLTLTVDPAWLPIKEGSLQAEISGNTVNSNNITVGNESIIIDDVEEFSSTDTLTLQGITEYIINIEGIRAPIFNVKNASQAMTIRNGTSEITLQAKMVNDQISWVEVTETNEEIPVTEDTWSSYGLGASYFAISNQAETWLKNSNYAYVQLLITLTQETITKTLNPNENIIFYAPNYADAVSYSNGIKYEYKIKQTLEIDGRYQLTGDDFIVFYWKDNDDDLAPYQYYKYRGYNADELKQLNPNEEPPLTIFKTSFSLNESVSLFENSFGLNLPEGRGQITNAREINIVRNTLGRNTLTGTNTITMQKKVSVNTKKSAGYAYWVTNTLTNDGEQYELPMVAQSSDAGLVTYSYILGVNEYFCRISNDMRSMEVYGSGTKISYISPDNPDNIDTSSMFSINKIPEANILNEGVKVFNTSNTKRLNGGAVDNYWEFTEMQLITLGSGATISFTNKLVEGALEDFVITNDGAFIINRTETEGNVPSQGFDITNAEVQLDNFFIQYQPDKAASASTLPALNVNTDTWQVKSVLNINVSRDIPQILYENQSIDFIQNSKDGQKRYQVECLSYTPNGYSYVFRNSSDEKKVTYESWSNLNNPLNMIATTNIFMAGAEHMPMLINEEGIYPAFYLYELSNMADKFVNGQLDVKLLYSSNDEFIGPADLDSQSNIVHTPIEFALPEGNYLIPISNYDNHLTELSIRDTLQSKLTVKSIEVNETDSTIKVIFSDDIKINYNFFSGIRYATIGDDGKYRALQKGTESISYWQVFIGSGNRVVEGNSITFTYNENQQSENAFAGYTLEQILSGINVGNGEQYVITFVIEGLPQGNLGGGGESASGYINAIESANVPGRFLCDTQDDVDNARKIYNAYYFNFSSNTSAIALDDSNTINYNTNSSYTVEGELQQLKVGDVNGDGVVNEEDATYLLYRIFFGAEADPLTQDCDFNGDGKVDASDATYLLYAYQNPSAYPIPYFNLDSTYVVLLPGEPIDVEKDFVYQGVKVKDKFVKNTMVEFDGEQYIAISSTCLVKKESLSTIQGSRDYFKDGIYYINYVNSYSLNESNDSIVNFVEDSLSLKALSELINNKYITLLPIYKYDRLTDLVDKTKANMSAVAVGDIEARLMELDSNNLYNYTYQPASGEAVENPLSAASFLNNNHIYNKFTICQPSNLGIEIINSQR